MKIHSKSVTLRCAGAGAKGGGHCPGLDMKIKINRGYIFLVLRLFGWYICTWVNNLQKKKGAWGGGWCWAYPNRNGNINITIDSM